MKQSIILSLVALSALTVVSCSKSQDALDTPAKGKVLVAYTDDNVNTRTALQNEVNVIWNSTDAITGFDLEGIGHQSQSITVDGQNASKATFQFGDDLSVVDDIYCALYPADASATMNDYGVITTTLPISQVATAGSFGPGANIALADGGKEDLHFSNGGALLSFTVNNDNVKKVTLTVSGDYNVAGPVYANMDNGAALVQSTYAAQIKSVSLEGDFVNGSDYYFVVLPGEYTGLQLDIENAEGKVATLKNRNALSLNRNDNIYIANLPDLTAKWEADTPSLPEKVFFMETFGGPENSLNTNTGTLSFDGEDWVVVKGQATGSKEHTARFGTSSDQGSGTTPSITVDSEYEGKTLTLTFKAAAWEGDATTLYISANGASLSESSVTLLNAEWSEYTIDITNWTSPFTITFKGKQKSKARFYLDDVCVFYGSQSGSGGDEPSTVKVLYEFKDIPGFNDWGTDYLEHIVEYTEATVRFAEANHQTGTITDIPVTKGKEVSLVLKSAVASSIKDVKFICRKWTTKSQTITLHYSTDAGENYTSTGITSNNFTISGTNLPEGTNAVKITFSNASNQVGIESAEIDYYPAQ